MAATTIASPYSGRVPAFSYLSLHDSGAIPGKTTGSGRDTVSVPGKKPREKNPLPTSAALQAPEVPASAPSYSRWAAGVPRAPPPGPEPKWYQNDRMNLLFQNRDVPIKTTWTENT